MLVEKLSMTTEKLFFLSSTAFSFKERERSMHIKRVLNFDSNESLYIRICTLRKEKHCCFLLKLFWQFILDYIIYFMLIFTWKKGAYHSERGEGTPAGPELTGATHTVALALHLHVLLQHLQHNRNHGSAPAGSDVIRIGCDVTKLSPLQRNDVT